MWIMLNDAFFSVVHKECARDEVMVRARRKGDLEKVFGDDVKASRCTTSDYLYRAPVKRARLAEVLRSEVERISYDNFKDSVQDGPLHDAYFRVWSEMTKIQPLPPYSGGQRRPVSDPFGLAPAPKRAKKGKGR